MSTYLKLMGYKWSLQVNVYFLVNISVGVFRNQFALDLVFTTIDSEIIVKSLEFADHAPFLFCLSKNCLYSTCTVRYSQSRKGAWLANTDDFTMYDFVKWRVSIRIRMKNNKYLNRLTLLQYRGVFYIPHTEKSQLLLKLMILESPNLVTFPIYLWQTPPYPFGPPSNYEFLAFFSSYIENIGPKNPFFSLFSPKNYQMRPRKYKH